MRYALIKNNEVQNIIEAEEDFITLIEAEYDAVVNLENIQDPVSIGWQYTGGNFTKLDEVKTPDATTVSIRQLKLALSKQGLLSKVPAAIDKLDLAVKEEVSIEWQYATSVQINGFFMHIAKGLNLDDSALQDLFNQAYML